VTDAFTRVPARDGTQLAVHTRGSGPSLLCVPGGPGRASDYLEDLGGLTAGRALHLLDNRGSGRSELPDDRESLRFPRLADDVEDVCIALELDPADLLGHSAGCPTALLHAARYPARVRRLVLVTPSGRPFGWAPTDLDDIRLRRSGELWYADAKAAADALDSASPRMRGSLEREMRPFWYGRWDERTKAHAASADTQVSLRAGAGYPPGPGYDVEAARESLRSIDVPVLIVVAELDALTGVAVADRFAAQLPRTEVRVIPGAGHFPWVDQPDGLRSAVEGFLAA
jgi:pimeloyl-ACP methyl ester carboxylesterase